MKHKSVYLALVILFSLTNTSVSSAQGAIAAGTIMGGIITQLENSIATLIDQLDNRVSARSFQMRTELVFLQDEIAHTAESLAYKTFSELSNQQQIFFENATTTVDSVRSSLKQADAEIDSLATQIEQVAAQFPFVGEEPRIRKSTPVFLKELPNAENSVPVQIVGSFLKHGGVVLSVGNDECKVTGHNDSSASFVCPGKAFPLRGNKVTYLSGSLTVHQKMSFWENITSFFGSESSTKNYKLPFAIVPSVLGSYEIKATYLVDSTQKKNRSRNWGRTNDHCKGRQSFQYNYGPASAEWEIDVNSIRTTETCGRGGQGHAVRNASKNGFQIESWSSNSGRCERIFGSVVSKDARGCSIGAVSWTETKVVPKTTSKVIKTGKLEWGKAVSTTLPSRLKGILITVNQIDGNTVVLNSATPSKWFSISRDGASTSLVLSPLELKEALQ